MKSSSSSTENNSSLTDLLDQLDVDKKTIFQLIPNFRLPVDRGFGYVYDKETNRLYIAGGVKDGKHHDKLYEIEMRLQDDETTSSSSSSSSSLMLGPRVVRARNLPHGKGIEGCVCAKLYNKIYVIGGWDRKWKSLKDVYSFDIATSRWEKEAPMGTKRNFPSVASIKGGSSMMVCGGLDASGHGLNTCEEYNPTTKQWSALPSLMNEARHSHVSFYHESRLFVVGGHSTVTKQRLATTEVIDLNTSDPQWNFGPQMLEKRDGFAGCLVGDYVIVGGGYNGSKFFPVM